MTEGYPVRCYLLFISIVLLVASLLLLKERDRVHRSQFDFAINDYPLWFKGDFEITNNVANGRFDFNIIDIFAGFKGDKSLYLDLKEQIEAAPQPVIAFQSLQLPKSGYFNMRGILIIGETKHLIHGVGFRNTDSIEVKFPVTLDEIGLNIPEKYQDSFPRRVNIIGYIDIR